MSEPTQTTGIHTKVNGWALYLEKYFEGIISLILLTIIFAIILSDIIRRTLFGDQLIWGFEFSVGLFIWVAWLTASFALRHESHFRFTLFRKKMSQETNLGIYIIEWLLWIMVIGVLFWNSIPEFMRYMEGGRLVVGTPIPEAYFYLAIPVSTGLIIVRVFQNMYFKINRYRNGQDIRPDAQIGVNDR